MSFINEQTGAQRTEDGGLTDSAGTDEGMDALAVAFADETARDGTLAEAQALAGDDKWKQYYVKVMEKIGARGNDWPAVETARLERILASGSLRADKRDSFAIRLNILARFT